ncbi:Hypothetical protein PHPALM_11040, partial [Phytophthora palmivora]
SMIDEDEHAPSCPRHKHTPRCVQPSPRLRSFSRIQEKATMKRSPLTLSPYGSQQQLMTIKSIVNPSEPDVSFDKRAAAVGKKRSTRSLFPAASESDRRAKQRLIVKRCYYKKIVSSTAVNTIKSLRTEATNLEQQFRSALHAMQQEDETTKAASRGEDVKLREMFLNTLTTKETLREENIRLRRLADEYYMKNQGRLRQLLDSNHKGLILFTATANDN